VRAAAFVGMGRPCVIEQHLPHSVGGDAEEVRTVLPVDPVLADQPHVSFVNQRSRLERVARPLALHVRSGHAAQLPVDQRDQLIGCVLITLAHQRE
jgi:hypothetical protein